MAPQNQQEMMNLYLGLMEEIKTRLTTISTVASRLSDMPTAAYEYSLLQIRFVCELIALACLTAHGDIRSNGD